MIFAAQLGRLDFLNIEQFKLLLPLPMLLTDEIMTSSS
jgi:hypothetical protein